MPAKNSTAVGSSRRPGCPATDIPRRGVAQATRMTAGQADHAQRGRECSQAVRARRNRSPLKRYCRAGARPACKAGASPESDPGIQALHETGTFRQALSASTTLRSISGNHRRARARRPARAAQQLVEPARARAWPRLVGAGLARRRTIRRRRPSGPASARSAQADVADRHPGNGIAGGRFRPALSSASLPKLRDSCTWEAWVLGPFLHQRLGAIGAAVIGDDDLPAVHRPTAGCAAGQQDARFSLIQAGMTQLTLAS